MGNVDGGLMVAALRSVGGVTSGPLTSTLPSFLYLVLLSFLKHFLIMKGNSLQDC